MACLPRCDVLSGCRSGLRHRSGKHDVDDAMAHSGDAPVVALHCRKKLFLFATRFPAASNHRDVFLRQLVALCVWSRLLGRVFFLLVSHGLSPLMCHSVTRCVTPRGSERYSIKVIALALPAPPPPPPPAECVPAPVTFAISVSDSSSLFTSGAGVLVASAVFWSVIVGLLRCAAPYRSRDVIQLMR